MCQNNYIFVNKSDTIRESAGIKNSKEMRKKNELFDVSRVDCATCPLK
jgi:hypothetical protein